MESSGPSHGIESGETTCVRRQEIEMRWRNWRAEGQVLRGRFTQSLPDAEIEWCNRRVLARIHRTTLGRLRREIEPVTPLQFHAFLTRWQHVAPGSQLHGADGVLEIIRQLQGYEIPAAAWESQILRATDREV